MKDTTINKISWGIVFLLIFLLVFVVGLLSWGFIEFILSVTSD